MKIIGELRATGCVFAEDEAEVLISSAQTMAELMKMVEQRAIGLPLEHIVGWAEFCGLKIGIEPGVFVPRKRTEFLVQLAVKIVKPGSIVADLCCGSGAVGLALLSLCSEIELHASDVDPVAVQCARRNIAARGQVYEGDLYTPIPSSLQGRIDVITVNAPYVPTSAIELMPQEARRFEPTVALDGGADGLDIHRRVASEAAKWLSPYGCLFIETSTRQAPHTADIMARGGLMPTIASSDELDATVVIGTRR